VATAVPDATARAPASAGPAAGSSAVPRDDQQLEIEQVRIEVEGSSVDFNVVRQPLRESLRRLLDAHQPNPALIVDGLWNLIEANPAASLLWDGVDPALLEPPINMLRLAVHPGGLPSISSMTPACSTPLIHQLKRKSRDNADEALGELIGEIESYLPAEPPAGPAINQPMASLELHTPLGAVSLFTLIATLGAPLEVTAANLAIETFLPADAQSAARLWELAQLPDQAAAAPA
jgi:MmyB-like transcription regulator ligand binding domain